MRKLESFLAWYAFYRRSHVLIYRVGRWESFWLAVKRVCGERK